MPGSMATSTMPCLPMVSGEPLVTGGLCSFRWRVSVGTIMASETADTTANTAAWMPSEDVKKLANIAAAAPMANHTDTSAVVAVSTAINATMATSQRIVSNHIQAASFPAESFVNTLT